MSRWPKHKLCDLVRFVGGGTPSRETAEYWNGVIPWASVKDFKGLEIGDTLESITEEGLRNSASNLIPKGTVIIASRVGLGKVAISTRHVAINQDLKALVPKTSDLSPRFLLYFFLAIADQIEEAGVGATVKGVTLEYLGGLELSLPPLPEQERIVQILDEAEALKRCSVQADSRLAQALPAYFCESFGNPTSNSMGLPTARLGDIAKLERGKFTPRPRNDPAYFGGSYPFIQTGDINSSGGLLSRWHQTLNERGKAVSKEFLSGTIVFAIVGATIGATAILQIPVYCPDSVVGIHVDLNLAFTEYVEFVLRARRPLLLAQAPDAARANLNLEILRDLQIPLAPFGEQSRFVEFLLEIRALEAEQATSRNRLNDLFQSLLYRAFQGEL